MFYETSVLTGQNLQEFVKKFGMFVNFGAHLHLHFTFIACVVALSVCSHNSFLQPCA